MSKQISELQKKTVVADDDYLVLDTGEETYAVKFTDAAKNLTPLDSPNFTGTPSAPTASVDTNTTQIATTEFVQNRIAQITSTIDEATEAAKQELQEDAEELKQEVNSLSTQLRLDVESSISEVRGEMETVSNHVDYVEQTTGSYGTDISAIKSEIEDARKSYDEALYNTLGEAIRAQVQSLQTNKIDGGYVEDGYLILTSGNDPVGEKLGPFSGGGGGGGGSSTNNAKLTVQNTTGWLFKSIMYGKECPISVNWSSIEDEIPTGNGTMRIVVNNIPKVVVDIAQGDASVDLSPYLSSGSNTVRATISDVYGNARTITFTVNAVEVSLESRFDGSTTYSGNINYTYIPYGTAMKTVHFILDGTEIGTTTTNANGAQQSYLIPAQSHGTHVLRVYFTCMVGEDLITSNELYYDLICVSSDSNAPIISSDFTTESVPQYTNIRIPYIVYTPSSLTSVVTLYVNGTLVNTITIDRTQQTWTYKADSVGPLTMVIRSGVSSKTFNIEVTESEIDAEAVTDSLVLYLTANGRSNGETYPATWKYGLLNCTLSNFNFINDGWQHDDNGDPVLRVLGDARVTIPYKLFGTDFRGTGKTIELEFATRDVRNYDTNIISCMEGGRGLDVSAQKVALHSDGATIGTQYKEEEHVRISFVVEKNTEHRLMYVYINGIMSGCVQYPENNDFSQANPVDITIGSNDCTTDIYNIRVYDNNLNSRQIVTNWIADTSDIDLKLERYERNDIFEGDAIDMAKLPNYLPRMIISAAELPQSKGDKKTVSGSYIDPLDESRSFTFEGCEIDVQGTSSAGYARKNYDMKFKKGFETESGHLDNYPLGDNSVPFNRFVVKADVASSESTNNTGLTRYFNQIVPYKTPEQEADPRIRQGIYGYPIVIFWNDTANNKTIFLGKYNFNHPKRAPQVLGFTGDMESWEWQNNTSNRVLFKSDDFDEMYTDQSTGETFPAWYNDFEARFPSDEWRDITKLKSFISWVVSTDREQATNTALDSPVTYGGVEYTTDSAEYRLAKFKEECPKIVEMDSAVFYYIFTEVLLMVDSRAKNMFPSFAGSAVTLEGSPIDRKVIFMPYDMDTGLGTNNEGDLVFSYDLEDTMKINDGKDDVFNGQNSVFWCNLRDSFPQQISSMYQTLRSTGHFSYDDLETLYEEHQSKWSESIFNVDAQFKYIDPLVAPEKNAEPTSMYLKMLYGSKAEQRKWWLYNRFRYMDSKFNVADALRDHITIRGYNNDLEGITITPYADIYAAVKYGSYLVRKRAYRNEPIMLECPLDNVSDTEIYIYSAGQIADVGDLSGLDLGWAEFQSAVKLQSLKIGDASPTYRNGNLKTLTLGANTLLKTIDVRNCYNLGTDTQKTVDLSGCTNIENIYFDNTAVTGVSLPNGNSVKVLHLPATVSDLTILNQTSITEFEIPTYENITTLRLENASSIIDPIAILNIIKPNSRVRLTGLKLRMSSTDEIDAFFDVLDTMRGLDEKGMNVDTAQVEGTIRVPYMTGEQGAAYAKRYPYIVISADDVTATLRYYTYDGGQLLYTEQIRNGADGTAYTGRPSRTSSATSNYTFAGWSRDKDADHADPTALSSVTYDRDVYAAYTVTVRTYTITFNNSNGTRLAVVDGVPYGGTAEYPHEDPVHPTNPTGFRFSTWSPSNTNITGNRTCVAQYTDIRSMITQYISGTMVKLTTGATNIRSYSIGHRSNLEEIEFTSTDKLTIQSQAIYNRSSNYKIRNIIINSTSQELSPNTGISFYSSDYYNKIKTLDGAIYVPDDLVSQYRSSSVWGQYFILPKSSYPSDDLVNITDSWRDIATAEANGTYKTKYKVGDVKYLNINGELYRVQIAAIDGDDCSDGSGAAPITWILKDAYGQHNMDTEHVSGSAWPDSGMRSWLYETVLPSLDREVINMIKEVNKTYRTATGETNLTTDSIWLLSARELGSYYYSSTTFEDGGVQYSGLYNRTRLRYLNGAVTTYWLRSVANNTNYYYRGTENSYYTGSTASASANHAVIFGFCT